MKKYLKEDIINLSYREWVTLMCDELNKAGIKYEHFDLEYEYSPDILKGNIIHYAKALNYLKEIGLIDNGRCTCGDPYFNNNNTVSSYLNKNLPVYICESCYAEGVDVKKRLNNAMNPQSSNKSGCMSSIVFFATVILIISILI
jgi:hypothetical protein